MAKEMRRDGDGWNSGRDAAYIKPKFIPDDELLPRDDSGGPDWEPRTAMFGDGGDVTGAKAHLSARGGEGDREEGDEIAKSERRAAGSKMERRRD